MLCYQCQFVPYLAQCESQMVAGIARSPSAVKGGPAPGPACPAYEVLPFCKQLQDAARFLIEWGCSGSSCYQP